MLTEPHPAPATSDLLDEEPSNAVPSHQTGVLIIIQNLHVPFDRRVWLECQALRDSGYSVSVVCPMGPDDPKEQVIDGITVYKYKPHADGTGFAAFVSEYVYSFVMTAWLVAKAWRRERFQIIQACNPPDIFWPLALLYRTRGVRFIFDHHDLCPELYESRFTDGPRIIYWALRAFEWCTFRTADHVVSTNGSYREIALRRSNKREDQVTIVRTGPDPTQLKAQEPSPELRRGRSHLVSYLGVMGPQDGVDLALQAAHHIVYELGRHDISFTLMGSGDSMPDLLQLREELKLEEFVELPGRVPDDYVAAVLSTSDVALCPDPKNPLNDLSTMNKTMEYMAFSVPVVAFDLRETRVSAADAALYARPNVVEDFAQKIVTLIDDKPLRDELATAGRRRVEETLAWTHQRNSYIDVFNTVAQLGSAPISPATSNGR